MKRIFTLLLAILLFSFMNIKILAEEKAENIAIDFLNDVFEENFETVYIRLTDEVKEMMTLQQFKDGMSQLVKQLGKPVSIDEPEKIDYVKGNLFSIHIEFETTALDCRIIVEDNGEISTFHFMPSSKKDSEAMLPVYVDTNTFKELDTIVITGEYKLPAKLTIPKNKKQIPAVVLVHGSGPNDMDETVMGAKVFRDIAYGLSSNGIAVLRYDKRTFAYGEQIGKELDKLTLWNETIEDAISAAKLLKNFDNIDPNKIFILGHSQGAIAIPRLAQNVDFIAGYIMVAGSPRDFTDIILEQYKYIFNVDDKITEEEQKSIDELKEQISYLKSNEFSIDSPRDKLPMNIGAAWWKYILEYDVLNEAKKITKPVLILQGERDYQITMKDFNMFKDALSHKKNYKFKSYPKLNHLLIEGEGKSVPMEYMKQANVSEEIIIDIVNWIKNNF